MSNVGYEICSLLECNRLCFMQSSGSYSLGPRAMLELHPYLKRVYEDDIVDCMMCHTIAIKVRRLSCSLQQYYMNFDKRTVRLLVSDHPKSLEKINAHPMHVVVTYFVLVLRIF